MASFARQVAGSLQNSSLAAAFRCSGRSSIASKSNTTKKSAHLEVPWPAGFLGQERFYFFCHPRAVNYLGAKRNSLLSQR